MNTNQGSLHFSAGIDMTQWQRNIEEMRQDIFGLNNTVRQETGKIDSAFKNLSLGIAGYFSANALKGFVMELINIRGEFQKTEIAFSTMLGNGGQAKQLMGQMVNLAAKTPFSLQDVSNGAKQLLAFQVPANEVVDTLTRMGNIAAGLSVPIQRINLVYGQVKAKGKLMGDDLRQFTEAGIPMIHELAKAMGKADSEIAKMVSDGKIGFEDVKKVLFNLTNEGGMFFNLMEEQSATLSGKISNLGDAWDQMLNKIGQSQEGALGQGIDALAYLVDHYKEVLNIIEALVVVYGAYRAALITISAVEAFRSRTITRDIAAMSFSEKMALGRALVIERQAQANLMEAQTELAAANAKLANAQADKTAMGAIMASNAAKEVKIATTRVETAQEALSIATKNASALSEMRLTAAQQLREASLRALAAAEAFLNATMLSNPYVLVTVAVVGLIYAYFKLRDTTTALEKAEKSLAENRQKNTKILDELTSKTQEYLNVLRSDYATALQKRLNYEKLLALYPDLLKSISMETLATMDLVEANKLLAKEKDKKDKDLLIGDIEKTKEQIKNLKTILSTNGITGPSAESLGLESHNWSGMTGYRKDLEAAEIALKKQQFLLDRRNESEKIANMTVEQRKTYYENELKSLESQLFQHKQKNKHLKDADILTIKLGNSLSNLSVSSLILEIKKAQAELSSLQSAAKPVDKNKAFWEAQKKEASDANDNMSGKQIGGAEWNNNIKKIREADLQLKKYDYSLKKTKKEGRQIAEILPVGSIAELERSAGLIDKAVEVAINGMVRLRRLDQYGNDKDKKGKPYYTGEIISIKEAKEKAEALREQAKKLRGQSFDEEISETERQWKTRYKIAKYYGEEIANAQFPNLKGNSYFDEIKRKFEILEEKRKSGLNLTNTELSQWDKLKVILDGLLGEKDPLSNYTDSIDKILEKIPSIAGQIDFLQKEVNKQSNNKSGIDKGFLSVASNKYQEKLREQQKQYAEFLIAHRSFEEKKTEITEKYSIQRDKIDKDISLSPEKKVYFKNESFKAEKEALSTLTVEAFRASKDWELAFSNIEYVSRGTAERVVKQLIEWRDANKNALNPQDYKIVSDKIEEFQRKAVSAFSIQPIVTSWRNYRKAAEDIENAEKELEEANKELALSFIKLRAASTMSAEDAKKALEEYNISAEKAKKAKEKLDQQQSTKDSFLNNFKKDFSNWGDKTSQIVNQVGGAINSVEGMVTDLGGSLDNEFGDALEKMKGVLEGVSQVADGMKEFATGGPVGMVTGSIKMIGGLIKSIGSMFNNDKKKERAIKREAETLKELKSAYEDLAYAANKALGSDKYDAEKRSLQNIRDQQARLREMYRIEGDKKKSDSGKMDEYKEQIKSLDRQYQDLVDSIAKDFLQTDAKDMASQLTDGLVEALSKGESALDSLDKKANDVFANMAKSWVRSRLEKSMGSIFDDMLQKSGINKDGTGTFTPLTAQQMNEFKERMKNATKSQQEFLEQYKEFFQDANTSPKGFEGAVKGMSEQTADLFVGQFQAIRINVGEILKVINVGQEHAKQNLFILSQIKGDTSNLTQMRKDLSELNNKITNNNGLRGIGL
ncbi:tape measure protein [Elizabethkingia miricola]|uniref:tape measure protein n=1 Tax=Elizabethkingia miricola TaxID=172045 RepID=UPI00389186E9